MSPSSSLTEYALRILEEAPPEERRARAQGMLDLLRYLAGHTLAQRWLWDDLRARFEVVASEYLKPEDDS